MRIDIDLYALPADAVGELLRAFAFEGEGLGCYSTFEVRSDARPLSRQEAMGVLDMHDAGPFAEEWPYMNPVAFRFDIEDLEVTVAWWWDGDGTLLFAFDGHALVNTDCKKSYGWEWSDRRTRIERRNRALDDVFWEPAAAKEADQPNSHSA